MVTVRSLVLKGLLEGLVLYAIEREPIHGYGIIQSIEEVLGEAPNKNQVYPLLRQLEDDGFIESHEDSSEARTKQVYTLTDEGEGRLDRFRTLPPAFKRWVVGLFDLPETFLEDELEQPDRSSDASRSDERSPSVEEDWVPAQLESLPRGPPVRAPYARVSMDRTPGTGSWTLKVEHHEPGDYEQADECPLTFLYAAARRLLFETPR